MFYTIFIFFVFIFSSAADAEIISSFWTTEKSDHFVIYYQDAPREYVGDVLKASETYYNTITEELGFTRFDNFWTWEERAKIYLFKDRQEYQKNGGGPEWSEAGANVVKREIQCYLYQENFFEDVLPHELGHLIFREFIGYKRKLPLWLDEGIAIYLEKKYRQERLFLAKILVTSVYFMPLSELEKVENGKVALPVVFYAEAASAIEFLLVRYGADRFVQFCRRLRDLRSDQDWTTAFKETYSFSSLSKMEADWKGFLIQ